MASRTMMLPAEGRDSTVATSCWRPEWEGGTTLASRPAALAGAANDSERTSVEAASVPFNMRVLLFSWESCSPGAAYATGQPGARGHARALAGRSGSSRLQCADVRARHRPGGPPRHQAGLHRRSDRPLAGAPRSADGAGDGARVALCRGRHLLRGAPSALRGA